MILKNHHSLFFGTNLHPFQFQRKKLQNKGFCTCKCCNYSKRCRLVSQALNFPNFSAQNVVFSRKDLILRNGSSLKCANELGRDFSGKKVGNFRKDLILRNGSRLKCANEKEPYFVNENLENYLRPLLKEGLLLIRASVYTAVLGGVCMLVWYGQNKAKVFVENNLLPSVCLAISEYIQRDVEFGKVRRISPLSITLEACSIGPHKEEFSCGEVPTVKIRVRPFASLRRGKVVVDAVLTQPSVLVVQKKDFTWLGIPFTEGGRERRFSSEDGIDYRTRTRRLAREEGGARWEIERDEAAREAAEVGYFVSERRCGASEGDGAKEIPSSSIELSEATPFFCVDGGKHDHRFMDTGVDYDTKHADLEKAFGVKFLGSGFRFWSRVLSGHRKNRFKRKANGSKIYASGVATKKRMFERSASAARAYFRDQSQGKDGEPASSSECFQFMNHDDAHAAVSEVDGNAKSVTIGDENISDDSQSAARSRDLGIWSPSVDGNVGGQSDYLKFVREPNLQTGEKNFENLQSCEDVAVPANANSRTDKIEVLVPPVEDDDFGNDNSSGCQPDFTSENLVGSKPNSQWATYFQTPFESLLVKFGLTSCMRNMEESISCFLSGPIEKLKSDASVKVEDIIAEPVDGLDFVQSEGINKALPVILDSVHFKGATVMLLAYGDVEVREMENVNGHVKLQNHYSRIHVHLSGNCNTWRSDILSEDGGWLSVNVFVDIIEQNWHVNLKIDNLFVPLFERLLEIPIMWSKGRASGEVHLCMSKGETFPNLHGQLDVTGLDFQLLDAPSGFSNISTSLCFRGQRIFLHNANGRFGSVPLEASGDFGIHPEEGEFHLMCQVPAVEVNALMRTFKMKPLLFPLAGSVTALFNCQGPLDSPVFVGTGMVSRTFSNSHIDTPASVASEALAASKEAGALAAFDRIPLSYASANFTFNTDNCVADLYGIRACLIDGGEIRGAGNAWICPEGEVDETAIDVNLSGSLSFDNIVLRYMPSYYHQMPLKLGVLNGETKLSGALLKPRFDIKWTAPTAEGSFGDARGDIIISHEFITVNSSSAAFDLCTRIQTSYLDDLSLNKGDPYAPRAIPFTIDGVEMDLRMRGFEFFNLVSAYTMDSPRPLHLKASGRVKFQGKVLKPSGSISEQNSDTNRHHADTLEKGISDSLVGEVSISGLKLNQLMLAPQLSGLLTVSPECIKLDASGRPDESLAVEFVGPLQPNNEDGLQSGKLLSVSLQKGQLRANVCFQPFHSANLEVRHFPLDELELASLRGTIQRAELQLNLQKRRGHGVLSVLQPKFSGVLGEALDVAARWSGDVITIEKTVLQQNHSYYELQGEYVLPGTRDRNPIDGGGGLFKKLMSGHRVGSVISSMGRWRMKLEVPRAEVAEMLPLARLLSRSMDPAVHSRSKDFFLQSLQSVGVFSESLQQLLEKMRGLHAPSNDVVLEDLTLPGLSEFKGHWHGSLDASGGGNGDTLAEFDFHGEDWEWGDYKTQRVVAVGAYSHDDGMHLEKIFIQKDNATIHADGTLLGPKTNLHFAVLNFPVSLVPTVVQVFESTATDVVHSLRQLLAPIRGILHMEGDLRGSLAKPECDVQVRLLDGAIGGIDLERAELVASLTSTSRFLFNSKLEPVTQSGHVLIQGSIPVAFVQNNTSQEDVESDKSRANWVPDWVKEKNKGGIDDVSDKKVSRDKNEDGWNTQLAESLKGLNWQILDAGEVRIDADIKDGGMTLVTALSPHANWLHGNADVMLEVRGTVDQPVLNGHASFHRASISSPVFRKPLTNFGGTVNVKSNRLCITSLESRVSRKGKLLVKGNLPLRTSEAAPDDKIELKCEVLEVRAPKTLSGQVDSQLQITGSILQPNISGNIKLSHGEAYLPHDRGGAPASNRFPSNESMLPSGGVSQVFASRYVSRFFSSESPASAKTSQSSGSVNKSSQVENEMEQVQIKPNVEICLNDLKLVLGPELKIVYPLILNFAVSGELELNGLAHPKWIKPRGILAFENGEIDLVATQVRLKREHLNIAKFEPEYGLDPMLDLVLVGSEWQFRIQGKASNWQDKLVVTSTRSVEQEALSPTEAARRFESQLAESILEGNGQLAFEKLATATLEKLMPRIEGKGEFGQARWRVVYAPQIPSLVSVDPTADPLKSLASNISFGTEVEVQLGKRLQATIVRQMKESEMAMQWTLSYLLTSRLRVLLQSSSTNRLLFEYSATSQD
ncbi:putative translocation and assembly module TamB [Medicago truncatula]|uniref:Embryo defective 2410 protein n=1 Tax=Medicago truncatula TaxID=3880 RepID=A0A072VNV3_MEDTR|nr:protein TIC236, chloroplastic [Medicago truncatula]KEH39815.1 embryo defective 2410 protein [Medicago truncatula]RHN76868.1 putative translocation and assembly module TamB [Medicago truncatula]